MPGTLSVETGAILDIVLTPCLIMGGETFPYPVPFYLVQSFRVSIDRD